MGHGATLYLPTSYDRVTLSHEARGRRHQETLIIVLLLPRERLTQPRRVVLPRPPERRASQRGIVRRGFVQVRDRRGV